MKNELTDEQVQQIKNMINSSVHENIIEYHNKQVGGPIKEYGESLLKLAVKVKDLEGRIIKLESLCFRFEQPKEIVSANPHPISPCNEQRDHLMTEPQFDVAELPKEDCLYFLGVAKGTFTRPTKEPEECSLYKFVKTAENTARVYVVDNPNVVRKFKSNPDAQETACEQVNQCPEKPRGIETVEPGEAFLDGTKWVIKTKVKISYL